MREIAAAAASVKGPVEKPEFPLSINSKLGVFTAYP